MSDLGQQDILITISKLLAQNSISYLLSGSLAGSYYGYPRATHDIDFVIEVNGQGLKKIIKALSGLGKDYVYSKAEIELALKDKSQFNIFHQETGIKVDFWVSRGTDFDISKSQRAKEIVFYKQKIRLVSAEDLILTKLLWCKRLVSERHLRDCGGILKVQKEKIDKEYLSFWLKKLKLQRIFKEIQNYTYTI